MVRRKGFSLLEIIAAVIILAVVATATVSTVAPMRAKSDQKMEQTALATLNGMSQTFYAEQGRWPTRNGGVWDLAVTGYIDTRGASAAKYSYWVNTFVWNDTTKVFQKK